MLLPWEAISEEPERFHLKKEKHKKPKQETRHNFAINTSDTESTENRFQGLAPVQSRWVRRK